MNCQCKIFSGPNTEILLPDYSSEMIFSSVPCSTRSERPTLKFASSQVSKKSLRRQDSERMMHPLAITKNNSTMCLHRM